MIFLKKNLYYWKALPYLCNVAQQIEAQRRKI